MTVFYLFAPGVPQGTEGREFPTVGTSGESAAAQKTRRPMAGGVRVGFTVPKALGPSVERNRIRRRMREAVRHNLEVLGELRGPVDVVINPRKTVMVAEFVALSQEVGKAFQVILRNANGTKATPSAAREAGTR